MAPAQYTTPGTGTGAASLVFDLRSNAPGSASQVCVAGAGADVAIRADLLDGRRVAPAGTDFRVEEFPRIEVVGGERLHDWSLPTGASSGAVVCYRTFTLDVFSNQDGWQLRADRLDVDGETGSEAARPLRSLYLGASCPGTSDSGLASLEQGEHTTLVKGLPAGACKDLLVVVAIRVAEQAAGTSQAEIRYTLLAPDAGFGLH